MLNNEELHDIAINLAKHLLTYKKKGRDDFSTEGDKIKNIETLWSMRKNSRFIDQLSIITGEMSSPPEVFRDVTRAAVTQMTPDQFQLFVSLTRFEYIFQLGQDIRD
jgi:F0F1-type ATP synthase beta subunit